jgi:hypothetical protein
MLQLLLTIENPLDAVPQPLWLLQLLLTTAKFALEAVPQPSLTALASAYICKLNALEVVRDQPYLTSPASFSTELQIHTPQVVPEP